MKYFVCLLLLILNGCASHYDKAGNYKDYDLTPSQAKIVAADMVAFLQQRFPARVIFSFPHANSPFSQALETEIRNGGMGVSIDSIASYHQLRFKVQRLNDTQFMSLLVIDGAHFSKLWVEQDNTLLPLYTTTVFGGSDD